MATKKAGNSKTASERNSSGKADEAGAVRRVRFTDTTFRDGHQSTLATRLRGDHIFPVAEELDKVGFWSLEVWGGATFDVPTRFLNEDPWERLRRLKSLVKKTPLQMLLRGQNLVGYRHYADDVVEAFVMKAAETGVDVFRVFDALNDLRNFETSYRMIRKAGKHAQGAICYSLTERKMGGPIYNLEYYVDMARQLEDMGSDSIVIKDMAGIIAPYDAYELISALKETVKIPVHLHTHYTSGMASMAYLKAIEAGADVVDTALAPFALRSSQPAIEPIVVALERTRYETGLDLDRLLKLGDYVESIAPLYADFLNETKMAVIDTDVLRHQVPGGMLSNLVSQLKEADALDRIEEVYKELPVTRRELGYPPLVTPTSQIVGIQAVQNVLFGRYKMISSQVKDYAYGLYGKPPARMDEEVRKLCLKGYERGEKPIEGRPADILEPEMEKAREAVKGISTKEEDVLIYALYPTTGLRFLKWKYGLEKPPETMKPKTLEDVRRERELLEKAKAGQLVEKPAKEPPPRGPGARSFNVFVDGEYFQVEVEEPGAPPAAAAAATPKTAAPPAAAPRPLAAPAPAAAPPRPAAAPRPAAPAPQPQAGAQKAAAPAAAVKAGGPGALRSPMPGLVISYHVKVGDQVKKGDPVLVLEAMKMQNILYAPVGGKVKELPSPVGASVAKEALLCVIEPG
ncbi:MAG: pyruvate carboxylase subunit B [bacterium]